MAKSTFIAGFLAASLCTAHAWAGNLIDLQVIGRSQGQPVPVYYYGGKTYVVGAPGERYSVRLINRSNGRLLAVLSVDGVNAITGETASGRQSGYVLGPYESTEVTGWRKSESEVARFYFTRLEDSYAARTDRPNNVGVIGVAAFKEKPQAVVISPQPPYPYPSAAPQSYQPYRANEGASAPRIQGDTSIRANAENAVAVGKANSAKRGTGDMAAPASALSPPVVRQEPHLGTGHGEREASEISYTDFKRASSSPAEVVSVWYDSFQALASRGIIPYAPPPGRPEPQAFPGQFVPDPRR